MRQACDLKDLVLRPGFTPGRRDIPALLEVLLDESLDKKVEKAVIRLLGQLGEAALPQLIAALAQAVRPGRARLVHALREAIRLGHGNDVEHVLISLSHDDDIKTRLMAWRGLSDLGSAVALSCLLEVAASIERADERVTLAKCLAGFADAKALSVSRSLMHALKDSATVEEAVARKSIIGKRDASRGQGVCRFRGDFPLIDVIKIELATRSGLEALLQAEADERGFEMVGRGNGLVYIGNIRRGKPVTINELYELGLWTEFKLLPNVNNFSIEDLFKNDGLKWLESAMTHGVRYRISWGGATIAEIWELAHKLTSARPEWINDPRGAGVEFEVRRSSKGTVVITGIKAKKLVDLRSDYRDESVYAASHPVIARALVRFAEIGDQEVIWDPFMGGGTELIEVHRFLKGKPGKLFGTDIDPKAVETARKNLEAANCIAQIEQADSLAWQKVRPSLTITNPPLGFRVHRGKVLEVLKTFLTHWNTLTSESARLVWITPNAKQTDQHIKNLGLKIVRELKIDLGGFTATMQVVTH